MEPDYVKWTKESLVKRIEKLEAELKRQQYHIASTGSPAPLSASEAATLARGGPKGHRNKKNAKPLDPSRYSTRYVALKLAYLGKNYNGFEYQPSGSTATIEEELWKALVKSCLIFPNKPDEVDFVPYEYSKCGRTDQGVSAFGQVIAIRLRSSRPLPKEKPVEEDNGATAASEVPVEGEEVAPEASKQEWDPIADEIKYCRTLNRLLPPDIKVLAWAPAIPDTFSARFSCRERQYRYYFTQPAFAPTQSSLEAGPSRPGVMKDGWLDIEAMREGAKLFEGLHDFRNFCKIDPKKQINVYDRRVFECDIVEVEDVVTALPYLNHPEMKPANFPDGVYPKVYYFHVRGSAFLWHQIRHMIAIIFNIGQGLEKPSVISDLLNPETYPCKPNYLMADEVPLVLWDCIFPELSGEAAAAQTAVDAMMMEDAHFAKAVVNTNLQDSIDWVYANDPGTSNGLVEQLWVNWREKKIDELLASRLLDCLSVKLAPGAQISRDPRQSLKLTRKGAVSQKIFEGGNFGRMMGDYVPVVNRPARPSVNEINDKYAQSQGFATGEEMTRNKFWRSALRDAKKAKAAADAEKSPSNVAADS